MGTTGLVAILFTDLVGSTEAVARLGEEKADEVRQAHFEALREVIAQHSGTEVKNLGDGLMVAFAAASDAVTCAVAMQQAVERQNRRGSAEPLAMRVGVAVGEATFEDSDYFGTPVIEAARLCGVAGSGQVLVTEMARMLEASRGRHTFASLGSIELKGLPDPVLVHQVQWEPLTETGPPLPPRVSMESSAVFVGRAQEREILKQAWKEAAQGTRRVVFLAGEPGIGKTRLATQLAMSAHHQGAVVLLGTCDEDLAVPYEPFVEALRHLVNVLPEEDLAVGLAERGGELTRLLPELPHRISNLPPPQTADPETERYLLFNAVSDLVSATSRWRPVVLVLDDLHWATKPTVLMLKHLVRAAEPIALLLVGTYRDSEVGRDHPLAELLADLRRETGIDRLTLRGLSDGEALALMETLAGHEFEDETLGLAHAVYAETDGSPFFMRELLRHLAESGELVQEGDRWTYRGELSALGIPESVREVIGRRLSRLPDEVERLLALGAVIGRQFDAGVLAPLAELSRSQVIDSLEPARRARLVAEVSGAPGRFSFVHALIRDTLYDDLGPAQRMELHRAVGQTLESLAAGNQDLYVAELAYHWSAATPPTSIAADDVAKAARYAEQAGRHAMASLAYEEASHHFRTALRAITDLTRRCDLLIDLGEAQRCAGDPAHRETLLEAGQLATQIGDADRAAGAALANQRGFYSRYFGTDVERVAALEKAIEAIGPAATAVRARLVANLATELHFASDERRLSLGNEALAIARNLDDEETLAHVVGAMWFASWGVSSLAERIELAEEMSELAGRLGDPSIEFQAGVALFLTGAEHGDLGRAGSGLAVCAQIAERLGQPVLRWRVTYLQTNRALMAGWVDEVERLAEESLQLGTAAGQADAPPFSRSALSILRMWQGRPEEAAELVVPILEQFPTSMSFRVILTWAYTETGRTEEARSMLAQLRAGSFTGIPRDYLWIVHACLLALCRGDNDSAGELYDLLLPHREAMAVAQSAWIGSVAHYLGVLAMQLGRDDDADRHFSYATELHERLAARAILVHTRLEWARLLVRRGRPEDTSKARALLGAAVDDAQQLGFTGIVPRIEALLAGSL